jgi:ABC-type Zn uptake system ZnuABC Zn-binding protein ZnuA
MSEPSELHEILCRRHKFAREIRDGVVPHDFQPTMSDIQAVSMVPLRRIIDEALQSCPDAATAIVALLNQRLQDHAQITRMLELDAERLLNEKDPEGALWDAN